MCLHTLFDNHPVKSLIKKQAILDIWIIRSNIKIEDLNLKNDEVIDAKFVSFDEFKKMLDNNEVVDNLSYFIDVYNNL